MKGVGDRLGVRLAILALRLSGIEPEQLLLDLVKRLEEAQCLLRNRALVPSPEVKEFAPRMRRAPVPYFSPLPSSTGS